MIDTRTLSEKIEQLEAEKMALQARVEELSDFIENGSLPLHWVDSSGIITWANQAELNTLGYSAEEYIGHSIRKFHADQDVIDDILRRLLNNETLTNYPARLLCKDGAIKYVLINSNVLQKGGEFVHTRCFTRDVTAIVEEQFKRSELLQEFELSEARLKMAIEATNLGIWEWDKKKDEVFWSAECKKILGVSSGNLAAISIDQFLSCIVAEDRERVEQELTRAMADGSEYKYDVTYRIHRLHDNELRWVRCQGLVDFDSRERAKSITGTMLDVTEAKQADIRQAELAAIIDSSYDAVVGKSLDGIVSSWNNSARRMFGFEEHEMVGQSILKIYPEELLQEKSYFMERVKEGERVEQYETQLLTKRGDLLDVSLTLSPIKDSEGNFIGVSKIARDITEKKQSEQRKNDFVAMVSHELRTPLTTILTYAQLLTKKTDTASQHFVLQAASKIDQQAKKMTALINDFLELAKMDNGKIRLHTESFSLSALIDEVLGDLKPLTPRFTFELHRPEAVVLRADRGKIGQVLINLVSNAIKYSPEGGKIIIGYEKVEGQVKVYVKDYGIGISLADQKRLFERFYRVDSPLGYKIAGFGIGLYLVSEILRYHDSRIHVEIKPGEGSLFYFVLEV